MARKGAEEVRDYTIMVINPGSTHDEVSIFRGQDEIFNHTVRYSIEDLKLYEDKNVTSQFEYRKNLIKKTLAEQEIDLSQLDAVIGRGGLLHPIPGGVFTVNNEMINDLAEARYGDHPCNLGAILANAVGKAFDKPAFIADSVVVDELWPLARYSGMPGIQRKSIFHCLNQKRVARLAAEKLNKKYEECNLIVCHAGGGITIGAHVKGKVVDVNNGLDGDGPFTPQRTGCLPGGSLAEVCFSGKYTLSEMKKKITRVGGLRAYLGTSDLITIDKYIKGEPLAKNHNLYTDYIRPDKASEVLEAMCYQIAREIGALSTAMKGKVDGIVLTGGVMYDEFCLPWITERVEWIAPIFVFPGSQEMRALRDAAERVLTGKETPMVYEAETSFTF